MNPRTPWTAAVLVAVVACSGKTTTVPGDGGTGEAGGGPCPSALPNNGEACSTPGLSCAFGDDPRPSCRDSATCMSGAWAVTSPSCPPIPPASCPPSLAAAQGQPCSTMGAYCTYDQGLSCQCTDCPNPYPICRMTPLQWACESANTQPNCPAAIPNFGTPCSPEGTSCTYGCEQGMARLCQGGIWLQTSSPGGCPVSTREAKQDIHYLSSAELEALAGQVEGIRLATYEYRDPVRAGKKRLGFILEDNPVPFGEDAEHDQVDLYGYASTLAAAIQVQDRRIEALELEVQSLRARCSK